MPNIQERVAAFVAEREALDELVERAARKILDGHATYFALGHGWKNESTAFSSFELLNEHTVSAIFYDVRDSEEGSISFPIALIEE